MSEAGGFRARFPGKPKELAESDAGSGLQTPVVTYKGIVEYTVTYLDSPTPLKDAAARRDLIQRLREGALRSTKAVTPRVVKESKGDIKGNPSYFLHFEVEGIGVARVTWVIVGNRLYTIITEVRKGSPNEMEGKDDFEKMAMGFINSFDLIQ